MIIIWNIAFNHICVPKEPWKWLLHVYITILYFRRKFQMSYNPLHFFSLYSTHLLVISPYSLRLWPQTHGFLLQFNIYVDSYPNPRYLQSTTFSICYILEHATQRNCSDSKIYQFKVLTPITTPDLSCLLIHGHYSTLWALQFIDSFIFPLILLPLSFLPLQIQLHEPEF